MMTCEKPGLTAYVKRGCRCDACCEVKAEADWRNRPKDPVWYEDLSEPLRTVGNPYGTAIHNVKPHLSSRHGYWEG